MPVSAVGDGTGLARRSLLAGIGENSSYAPIAVPPIDHREAALTALRLMIEAAGQPPVSKPGLSSLSGRGRRRSVAGRRLVLAQKVVVRHRSRRAS